MNCFICRETTLFFIELWSSNSLTQNIPNIIEKHLEWLKPLKENEESQAICQKCWSCLEDFHKFYVKVKNAYENFMCQEPETKYEITLFDGNNKTENEFEDILENTTEMEVKEERSPSDEEEFENNFPPSTLKEAFESFKPDENSDGFEINMPGIDIFESTTDQLDESNKSEESTEEFNCCLETLDDTNEKQDDTNEKQEIHTSPPKKSKGTSAKRKRRSYKRIVEDIKDMMGQSSDSANNIIRKYIKMACELCAFTGADFLEIATHLREQHDIDKPYIMCCGRKLNKKFKIIEHAYSHENPEHFKCKECNKFFTDSSGLQTHWLANHAPEKDRIFACDQCSKRFSRQHLLDLHKPSHIPENERKFFCEQCPQGKPFASERQLHLHINMRHKKPTNVCHVCAKVIRDKPAFEKHVRNHFEDSGPRVKCPKPNCDSWLKDKDNLKQHLKRHNDEGKLFVCNECGKSCKNAKALSSHFNYTHTKKTFSCELCHKAFKKAIRLKEHMTQHTGEALYQCPFCPKTFNSSANIHAHKKRMHPIEWDHWRKTKKSSAQQFISIATSNNPLISGEISVSENPAHCNTIQTIAKPENPSRNSEDEEFLSEPRVS